MPAQKLSVHFTSIRTTQQLTHNQQSAKSPLKSDIFVSPRDNTGIIFLMLSLAHTPMAKLTPAICLVPCPELPHISPHPPLKFSKKHGQRRKTVL